MTQVKKNLHFDIRYAYNITDQNRRLKMYQMSIPDLKQPHEHKPITFVSAIDYDKSGKIYTEVDQMDLFCYDAVVDNVPQDVIETSTLIPQDEISCHESFAVDFTIDNIDYLNTDTEEFGYELEKARAANKAQQVSRSNIFIDNADTFKKEVVLPIVDFTDDEWMTDFVPADWDGSPSPEINCDPVFEPDEYKAQKEVSDKIAKKLSDEVKKIVDKKNSQNTNKVTESVYAPSLTFAVVSWLIKSHVMPITRIMAGIFKSPLTLLNKVSGNIVRPTWDKPIVAPTSNPKIKPPWYKPQKPKEEGILKRRRKKLGVTFIEPALAELSPDKRTVEEIRAEVMKKPKPTPERLIEYCLERLREGYKDQSLETIDQVCDFIFSGMCLPTKVTDYFFAKWGACTGDIDRKEVFCELANKLNEFNPN